MLKTHGGVTGIRGDERCAACEECVSSEQSELRVRGTSICLVRWGANGEKEKNKIKMVV